MARELIVVPNENLISDGVWCTNLESDDRHGKGIHDYSLLHGLNLDFENVGDDMFTYNGYLWGTALSKLGHASLLVDDFLIIHVPNIITKEQYDFFNKHRKFIERYNNNVSSCFIKLCDGKFDVDLVMGDPDNGFPVSPVKLFYEELERRYNSVDNIEKGFSK